MEDPKPTTLNDVVGMAKVEYQDGEVLMKIAISPPKSLSRLQRITRQGKIYSIWHW
jgi:hypothetical protein